MSCLLPFVRGIAISSQNLLDLQTNFGLLLQLMIYGFASITGRPPSDINELGRCLDYNGHSIKQDRLSANIVHLRAAKKINKGESTLTNKARDTIKTKYIVPA